MPLVRVGSGAMKGDYIFRCNGCNKAFGALVCVDSKQRWQDNLFPARLVSRRDMKALASMPPRRKLKSQLACNRKLLTSISPKLKAVI